ncbi:protein of unknown function [Roseospirillum parvum]|uniref:YjiS-like domain-containing protein n=1 Tax=Roseospirillum parvum TaxID=83401 RepID=A0A1G8E399_9PROT|nr:protein of unknown function [Roseospirillum parvum]
MTMIAGNPSPAYGECTDSLSRSAVSHAALVSATTEAPLRGWRLAGAGGKAVVRGLGQAVIDLVWVGRAFLRRQAEYNRLAALDERMLRDIGLTRGDVDLVTCRTPIEQWALLHREMTSDRRTGRRH